MKQLKDQLTGMMVKVIEVQRMVVTRGGEGLIYVDGVGGEDCIEVVPFPEASDELCQGDVQTVAREVAMIGEGVDPWTRAAT